MSLAASHLKSEIKLIHSTHPGACILNAGPAPTNARESIASIIAYVCTLDCDHLLDQEFNKPAPSPPTSNKLLMLKEKRERERERKRRPKKKSTLAPHHPRRRPPLHHPRLHHHPRPPTPPPSQSSSSLPPFPTPKPPPSSPTAATAPEAPAWPAPCCTSWTHSLTSPRRQHSAACVCESGNSARRSASTRHTSS